jgi:hypothetical protein
LAGNASQAIQLKHFPIDTLEGIITGSGVSIDREISSDGHGSLKVDANQGRTVVRLFEINDITVDNAQLVYQARVRTKDVEGIAYTEMWCGFNGQGESFSRNPNTFLSGTNEWSTVMIYFFLKKGEKPDYIKLNLVIEGKGTAWIDDIGLFKTPLLNQTHKTQ